MNAYGTSSLNRSNPVYEIFLNALNKSTAPIQPISTGRPRDRYQSRAQQPAIELIEPEPKKMGLFKKLLLLTAGFWLGKKVWKHLPFPSNDKTRRGDLNTLA